MFLGIFLFLVLLSIFTPVRGDRTGAQTTPVTATLAVKGDITGNEIADLADVILALQSCTGTALMSKVSLGGDVDGAGKIGLAEAIYVMQEISGGSGGTPTGPPIISDPYNDPGEPVFVPRTIQNSVTDRTLLQGVEVHAWLHGGFGSPVSSVTLEPIKISVTCEETGVTTNTVVERTDYLAAGDIPLCPGFNTVTADFYDPLDPPGAPAGMHALLRKKILAIVADSDNDGLSDGDEADLETDPKNQDTDGDDLADGEEVSTVGTNPLNADTDRDGVSDGEEVAQGTDPLNPPSSGLFAYIPNSFDGTVSVIDTSTNIVIETIILPRYPNGMVAANPSVPRVYVVNFTNDAGALVSVIDTATNKVTDNIAYPMGPGYGAMNPSGTYLYLASYDQPNPDHRVAPCGLSLTPFDDRGYGAT
jgi:YVTN family beta-propeller protein